MHDAWVNLSALDCELAQHTVDKLNMTAAMNDRIAAFKIA